jgi:neutral ceramidase
VSQATGLSVQNIRASATHTHSGPVPYKSWIEKGYEMVAPWFDNVAHWSAEAATEALANLQPVRLRAGRGACAMNANRRAMTPGGERFLGINPNGPCDREVLVVRLDQLDGQPLATLVNYALPSDYHGPAKSARYPGLSRYDEARGRAGARRKMLFPSRFRG